MKEHNSITDMHILFSKCDSLIEQLEEVKHITGGFVKQYDELLQSYDDKVGEVIDLQQRLMTIHDEHTKQIVQILSNLNKDETNTNATNC
jgi:predicted metal-dependent hydrolase